MTGRNRECQGGRAAQVACFQTRVLKPKAFEFKRVRIQTQGHKVYSIAADSVLSIPGWRHVFSWVGARPATHRNFRWLLKKGSVGLVPGVSQSSCAMLVPMCRTSHYLLIQIKSLVWIQLPHDLLYLSIRTNIQQRSANLNVFELKSQGIAEMFMSEAPRADVVKLLDRKGFVRVAVEAGAPLVPIYVSQ